MIEQIQENIEKIDYATLLYYIDECSTEGDFILVMSKATSIESVVELCLGKKSDLSNLFNDGKIRMIQSKNITSHRLDPSWIIPHTSFSKKEELDCIYVQPAYIVKRRIK